MHNSGKLLIVAMLLVGLAAAGASWWFRYSATSQAAKFWGPRAVQHIRDAPQVIFVDHQSVTEVAGMRGIRARDVSSAPGITHLRNALLEDRSFDWPAPKDGEYGNKRYRLEFRLNSGDLGPFPLRLGFSDDLNWVYDISPGRRPGRPISCRPIAAGLAEIFAEFETAPVGSF